MRARYNIVGPIASGHANEALAGAKICSFDWMGSTWISKGTSLALGLVS